MNWTFRGILAALISAIAFGFGSAQAQMRKIYELPSVQYPETCLERHIEGTVVLRFDVTPSGKIKDIRIAKTVAACPEFTGAALSAVRRARVYPLPSGTRLLKQSIEVPITFSVSENEF